MLEPLRFLLIANVRQLSANFAKNINVITAQSVCSGTGEPMKYFIYTIIESDSFEVKIHSLNRTNSDRLLKKIVLKPDDWRFDRMETA
jgi:hypothetical protein